MTDSPDNREVFPYMWFLIIAVFAILSILGALFLLLLLIGSTTEEERQRDDAEQVKFLQNLKKD